jgi:transposase InsO family protein
MHLSECKSKKTSLYPNANLSNEMIMDAVGTLPGDADLLVHTDRGVDYRWSSRINILKEAGLSRSMSKKGCAPDNVACEGLFGRMKVEMFYGRGWEKQTTSELMAETDRYMKWCNHKRIKASLGGMSPIQYRISLGLVA